MARAEVTSENITQEPNERQRCLSDMNRASGKKWAREGENIQGKEWGFHSKFHEELLEDFKQESDVIGFMFLHKSGCSMENGLTEPSMETAR